MSVVRNLRTRRALTLIELLVVIIILTTLVAAAIPILAPADSDRANREATRTINTFITGAQSRATSIRRPFGIALKRLSQDTNPDPVGTPVHLDNAVCLELYYVEQPAPYAGFDANSRACVALEPNPAPNRPPYVFVRFVTRGTTGAGMPAGWEADLFPSNTIRPGDVIEIGDTRFELLGGVSNMTLNGNGFFEPAGNGAPQIAAQPLNDTGQLINPKYDDEGAELGARVAGDQYEQPYWTAPMPYKILRQPMPTSDPPLFLPEGVAIDLRASGFGNDRFFQYPTSPTGSYAIDNAQPVVIMFTPEGRVERLAYNQVPGINERYDEPVIDNVYLLVGRRENIPAPVAGDDPTLSSIGVPTSLTDEQRQELKQPINWLNSTSRWIVIGPQSGRVVSVENAFVDPKSIIDQYMVAPSALQQGSEQMRDKQIVAAREFTYDMANMGGR